MQETDTDGSCALAGQVQYWSAPGQFLGNQSSAFNGTLSCDLQTTATGQFNQENLILKGAGLTLVHVGSIPTPSNWFTYKVHFLADEWRINGPGGLLATPGQLQNVLGNLDDIYIRAEFGLGVDVGRIDNVVLTASCPLHTGDMNSDGRTDGSDITRFIQALIAQSRELTDTCPGDFNDSGIVEMGDIPGFVNVLLSL